jgi:phosphohistidine phosphatase
MKRLILFRHAKTERHAQSGDDFDRRLTEGGRDDAFMMGRVLAEAGFAPDVVLVSQAVRAQETWEAASPAFPGVKSECLSRLYSAGAEEVLTLAQGRKEPGVMIVAHNPAMHALAAWLLVQSGDRAMELQVRDGFPTAAMAVFDMDGVSTTSLGLFFPRDHGSRESD